VGNGLPTRDLWVGHVSGPLGRRGQGTGTVVIPVLVTILGLNGGEVESDRGKAE
jgi:hypothetical protein